jgi:hypothetical protein
MIPEYLDMVAAKTARSTIVVSDASRAAHEADAQALRTAIFLDEMFTPSDDASRGTIVVELKTGVSAHLVSGSHLRYVFTQLTLLAWRLSVIPMVEYAACFETCACGVLFISCARCARTSSFRCRRII